MDRHSVDLPTWRGPRSRTFVFDRRILPDTSLSRMRVFYIVFDLYARRLAILRAGSVVFPLSACSFYSAASLGIMPLRSAAKLSFDRSVVSITS